jgi:hypothetical protein
MKNFNWKKVEHLKYECKVNDPHPFCLKGTPMSGPWKELIIWDITVHQIHTLLIGGLIEKFDKPIEEILDIASLKVEKYIEFNEKQYSSNRYMK